MHVCNVFIVVILEILVGLTIHITNNYSVANMHLVSFLQQKNKANAL